MNYYNTAIVLIFIFVNIKTHSQVFWEKLPTPVNVDLHKVIYLDSLHLWAAGDSGTIIFSSDQGNSWEIQSNGLERSIVDIFFLNDSLGWALSWSSDGINFNSQILSTSNGGNDWQISTYRISNRILTTIYFVDSLNGWVGGNPYEFAYTNDGGVNWSPAYIDTTSPAYFPIYQIKFSSSKYGFAVGGSIDFAGVVWFTINTGITWKGYIVAPDIFSDFLFLDSINVISLSADIENLYPIGVLRFNLLQNSWSYTEIDKYGRVTGLDKRTHNEIWGTIANSKNFIVSTDEGQTWDFIPTPDSLFVFDLAFTDSSKGFAVGEKGYVFKYKPLGPSSVDDRITSIPNDFILYQNYPNPYNPSTKICWQSPVNGWQTLKIYDILGNEIATLVDEYKSAGKYEVEFNSDHIAKQISQKSELSFNYPSGVYLYQLRVGIFIQTKKMILLR